MRTERRFETLDALRGIAALAVMCFHIGQINIVSDLVPHGYLAVDFFFVLSGFVIAYAYEDALLNYLSWRKFVLKRFVRIYPLAALGAALGVAILLLKWHSFPEKVDSLPLILISGALNSLLLPTPFGSVASRHELFPGNGPLWSLSFEMAANLLWAAMGPSLRTRTLGSIVTLAGIAVAAFTIHAGTANQGFDLATIPCAVARVTFSFPLGVLIYRAYQSAIWPQYLPTGRAMSALLGGALFGVLALPRTNSLTFAAWDIAAVLVILPAIVVLGVAQGRSSLFGDLLGELSYPLYIIHFPVLMVSSGIYQTSMNKTSAIYIVFASIFLSIVLSFIASRIYDIPIRCRISSVLWPKSKIRLL